MKPRSEWQASENKMNIAKEESKSFIMKVMWKPTSYSQHPDMPESIIIIVKWKIRPILTATRWAYEYYTNNYVKDKLSSDTSGI